MLAKSKIIGILLIIIFCVSAITCGIVFGIVKSKPQSGAITGTETSLAGYIGNMLDSSGNINETTFKSLISKVGAVGSVAGTKKTSELNGGTPVIFQMGEVNSNPVYWQVTYRTKDYLTIMMTRPYTLEFFNNNGITYIDGLFGGAPNADYDFYGNYSKSTARDATFTIGKNMQDSYPILETIIANPREMASATGTNWQYSDQQQHDACYSSGYYSNHNGLYEYTGSLNTSYFTWDNSVYEDDFWLPSFYELYNTETTSSTFNGGLWGFTDVSQIGFDTTTFADSSLSFSYCWTRSGYAKSSTVPTYSADVWDTRKIIPYVDIPAHSGESSYNIVIWIDSSGDAVVVSTMSNASFSNGIRPACHISLSAINDMFARTVTFESNGGSACSSIEVENGSSYGTLPTPTRTNYTFDGWYKNSDLSGSPVSDSDIVTQSHTLYAKWSLITYNITISATNGGQVSNTGGVLAVNTTLSIIAYSNNETAFLYWLKDGAIFTGNTANPLIITITANVTYTAVFGASVEGVNVSATKGGVAYIVGDDYENLSDTDTITLATKPCLSGYAFSHWIDLDGNNLGTTMSIKLTKAQVMDNIITAVYVQISNANVNEDVSN